MPRMLIVEDEPVLRLTFTEFLKEEGYDAIAAEDYDGALNLIDEEDFDVVITDIILEGKTGVDLLRTIRDQGQRCQVVMITGEPNVETASEALRLGAFDYLPKPVTKLALVRVARMAVEHKAVRDERDLYAARMDQYRSELEAIFNSVSEGIISVDADMCVRQTNATACKILNLDSVAISGQVFSTVMPEQLSAASEALTATLKTGMRIDDRRIEFSHPTDGDRILIVGTSPLLGELDGFAGAILTIRDVTRLTRLEEQLEGTQHYRDMIGKSTKIQEIFRLIEDLAGTDSTALVCGESGTGKELVASALHHASQRAKGPFIRVNCAALSENILESELFGHVKGAFTGAVRDRKGRFEAADGGTLLLDEIGDVSPRLQLRLLRVLQEHEFERVGSSTPIRTDVRIIASTNQDLEQKIREGEFRQDLYYRLNVVRVAIPPLRDRREDIPLLVEHFSRQFNESFRREVSGVAPETMHVFMSYDWPGNVRELENCLERAFIVCHDAHILPKHLPQEILRSDGAPPKPASYHVPPSAPDGSGERERMTEVLRKTDWNVAKSARLLGIARNTLYQRMKALGIERSRHP
jgi:two-component system, NtrC family, response regulator HydG